MGAGVMEEEEEEEREGTRMRPLSCAKQGDANDSITRGSVIGPIS